MMETGGMGITQKRTVSGSTSDIISNLPCEIMEKILACLKIQEAARTSVLSRKWRNTWTTLPQLVFNDTFCRGSMMTATIDKLMVTIYKVLLLHHGPILKFTLSLAKLKSCPEIDPLVFFVSKNGIREFTLHIPYGEPYKLPLTLFSCLQLEHLNLRNCVFKPPPGFRGFTRLLSLEFYEVVIADDILLCLISGCPLLEQLQIATPNLKISVCDALFISLSCKNGTHLASSSLALKGSWKPLGFNKGELSNFVILLGNMPIVDFLALDHPCVKWMATSGVRERLPTTLNGLKYPLLHKLSIGEPAELSIVLYFIRSSPNLERIYICELYGATATIDPVVDLCNVQNWSDISLNKLLVVGMQEVSGTKVEMEFIKLVLAKSPILKTMEIRLNSEEVAAKLRIVEELAGFRRASTKAIITFPK